MASLVLLGLVLGFNASGQGFLSKMQKMKDKMNSLDNGWRETWLPFPDEAYHIKSITCAYGTTDIYKMVYKYNDNDLLSSIDLYTISPKSGREKFFRNLKTLTYNTKDSIVMVQSCTGERGGKLEYAYQAYKMRKGLIVASASSSEQLATPVNFTEFYYYNDARKLAAHRYETFSYNSKGQLVEQTCDFNGKYAVSAYTYDDNNPLLLTCKNLQARTKADTLKPDCGSYRIVSKGKKTDALVRDAYNSSKEKEEIVVTRDFQGRVVHVTDNTCERLLNATIEYEERGSNDKLFAFSSGDLAFYQFGNVASQFRVPFFLFYVGED